MPQKDSVLRNIFCTTAGGVFPKQYPHGKFSICLDKQEMSQAFMVRKQFP
jgi:hypothetical protein